MTFIDDDVSKVGQNAFKRGVRGENAHVKHVRVRNEEACSVTDAWPL